MKKKNLITISLISSLLIINSTTYGSVYEGGTLPSAFYKLNEQRNLKPLITNCKKATSENVLGFLKNSSSINEKELRIAKQEYEASIDNFQNSLDISSEALQVIHKAKFFGIGGVLNIISLGFLRYFNVLALASPGDNGVAFMGWVSTWAPSMSGVYLLPTTFENNFDVKMSLYSIQPSDENFILEATQNNCDINSLREAVLVRRNNTLEELSSSIMYQVKNRVLFGIPMERTFIKLVQLDKYLLMLSSLKYISLKNNYSKPSSCATYWSLFKSKYILIYSDAISKMKKNGINSLGAEKMSLINDYLKNGNPEIDSLLFKYVNLDLKTLEVTHNKNTELAFSQNSLEYLNQVSKYRSFCGD